MLSGALRSTFVQILPLNWNYRRNINVLCVSVSVFLPYKLKYAYYAYVLRIKNYSTLLGFCDLFVFGA